MRGRLALLLTLALLCSATASARQGKTKKAGGKAPMATKAAVTTGVEPLRSLGGELNGHTVTGDFKANGRDMPFTYTITHADIAGNQVRLSGDFSIGSRPSHKLQGTLVSIQATADNPWPGAGDEQPQEKPKEKPKDKAKQAAGEQKQGGKARNPENTAQLGELSQATQDTARKTPSTPGERNEQTQSLYVQADGNTGCGAFYLTMELPQQLRTAMGASSRPLQMNIVLATIDNEQGEQVGRLLCRAHRLLVNKNGTDNPTASLDKLNRILGSAK